MGSNVTKDSDTSSEYYQLLADSTMHASTWDELVVHLKKHIASGALDREWDVNVSSFHF